MTSDYCVSYPAITLFF